MANRERCTWADHILTVWLFVIGLAEAVHLTVLVTGRHFSDSVKLFQIGLAFLAAAAAFGAGSLGFLNRTGQRSQETLRKAITRACIQCYAIEGRYPPSVEYLEENYGIQIDHDKYNVFYDGFASNIMPEITVILAEQEDAVK